jgi:hypothetical protein
LGTKNFPFVLLNNVIDFFVVAMDPNLYDHWCIIKCQEKVLTMLNFIMIFWCVLEV